MFGGKPEEPMSIFQKLKTFLAVHYRGVVCFVAPIVLIGILAPFPPKKHQWCGYTLVLMGIYWLAECIPLEITSFLPVLIFPLTGVMTTAEVCKAYMNETILLFLGCLFLAFALEQCGVLKRLAYCCIQNFGGSHMLMQFFLALVTTFISMWITNTAATTLMVPVNFTVLKIFEDNGVLKMYDTGPKGEKIASDITTCYFCSASYFATIGGVVTLMGTATNLAFKGILLTTYPKAPDELTFLKFSGFGCIYVILIFLFTYTYMVYLHFGVFSKKGSDNAKKMTITPRAKEAFKKAIMEERKKIGPCSLWEVLACILFVVAVLGFLGRLTPFFDGWGTMIKTSFSQKDESYVRDSAMVMAVCCAMFLLPASLAFFKNCTAKFHEDLPKSKTTSVLDWATLNTSMPFSFMFLLGAGFVLCEAGKSSGLNDKIGETFKELESLPTLVALLIVIVGTVVITNFASNVVVANIFCPLAMSLAKQLKVSPLWFCLAAGYSASYCFILPIGTPGNMIVKSAASIPLKKMALAGLGPTIIVIVFTWMDLNYLAPIIWPDLDKLPDWAKDEPKPELV
ncbi:protein I'm not dead yet-like [Ostrinia nubilalis]|uniref:protein I'm not dead yet-like n=1 Tax=Ostrinia nubilalis TaxID=29057 RepID=UPI0030822149